jgi:hypothetical protein
MRSQFLFLLARARSLFVVPRYPLPGAMTQEDRVNLELAMGKVFDSLIAKDGFGGKYVSITPGHKNFIDEKEYAELVKAHIMFKDMSADKYLLSAGIARDWPHGRGCYISEDKQFIVWVGEEDHLRIMCMKKGTVLNEVSSLRACGVEGRVCVLVMCVPAFLLSCFPAFLLLSCLTLLPVSLPPCSFAGVRSPQGRRGPRRGAG